MPNDTKQALDEETSKLLKILLKNSDKNFVQRILNPKIFPVVNNPDGSYSTHRMASGEVGGKGIAFPTIFQDPDTSELLNLGDSSGDAFNYALQNNEHILFDTPEEAEWFAENYKKIWKGK